MLEPSKVLIVEEGVCKDRFTSKGSGLTEIHL